MEQVRPLTGVPFALRTAVLILLPYRATHGANSGGENISSIEVETVLHQHEAVLHVAVVAMPDPFWGEVPVAVIETTPGVEVMRSAAVFVF